MNTTGNLKSLENLAVTNWSPFLFKIRAWRHKVSAPNTACSGRVGTRRVLETFSLLRVFSTSQTESHPTHSPLTQAVGQPVSNLTSICENGHLDDGISSTIANEY